MSMAGEFFIFQMPPSRPADYCLGYLDSSVFIDFDRFGDEQVRLVRISFDGFGCCNLGPNSVPLDTTDSILFKRILAKEELDHERLLELVKNALALNRNLLWEDALERYQLI